MTSSRWALEPAQILALPIDKLALAVLRDFKDDDGWNSYNWMNTASQRYEGERDVMRALSEAWSWLEARGLIARDFSQSAYGAVLVTRAGERSLEDGLNETLAMERLQLELHPELETPVRTTFMAGDYDTAVLKALKQVEVRVRRMTSAKPSLVGVKLMQEAFKAGGPFWSDEMDAGEQVGRMDLFKGAIGFLKNPAGTVALAEARSEVNRSSRAGVRSQGPVRRRLRQVERPAERRSRGRRSLCGGSRRRHGRRR